jgi:hypothetical protein
MLHWEVQGTDDAGYVNHENGIKILWKAQFFCYSQIVILSKIYELKYQLLCSLKDGRYLIENTLRITTKTSQAHAVAANVTNTENSQKAAAKWNQTG